jgi:SulP family sulfate permease
VADGISEHKRHDPNQELMAQGVANMVTPFFGGMPATGTIARTVTNVRAGAATPVAGMVHAAVLLLILLVAAPLAGHVPLAALSAILLFVAWNMFEGHQFLRLRQFAGTYRTLMITTFVLTIVFDLTVAVEVGLVLACLFFIWRMGQLFSATPRAASAEAPLPEGVAVVELYGSLFFGAVGKIESLPEQLPAGTHTLVLDMQRLVSMDTTGLDALEQLWRTLQRRPVALVLAHVNAQPLSLMRRSGFEALIGPERIVDGLEAALRPRAA